METGAGRSMLEIASACFEERLQECQYASGFMRPFNAGGCVL